MSRLAIAAALLLLLSGAAEARGKKNERRAPRLKELQTKHYTLFSDCLTSDRRSLARFLQAMHRSYSATFQATPAKTVSKPVVYVFKHQADYAVHCRARSPSFNANARGMFFRSHNELVSYRGESLADCYSILSHEGFHQFSWEYFTPKGREAPPDWFEEGLAEYFRSRRVRSGKLVHQPKGYHLKRVKRAICEGWAWTQPQVWNADPGRIKDPRAFTAFYAHAYLLVDYLAAVDPKRLKQVFRLKRKGKTNDEVLGEVFPENQRERLHTRFLAWVAKR